MDDQRLGAVLRAVRLRRGLRQADVAAAAGLSDATISRIERGHLGSLTLLAVRRVAGVLDVRLELLPRTRGADLDRLVNARHAALGEAVISLLQARGWIVRPEVSFNIYGERGVVDLLAWHAAARAALVVELKTAVVDVGEALGTFDRKRRLAPAIARSMGWQPVTIGSWFAVADGATNRRRIAAHAATFRAALPDDGRRLRAWLRSPSGSAAGSVAPLAQSAAPLAALSFVADRHPGRPRSGFASLARVPTARAPRPRAWRNGQDRSSSPASAAEGPETRAKLPPMSI